MHPAADDITELIKRSGTGDEAAATALLERIYGDLRRIARARLRGEHAETLGTTALVHETWMAMAPVDQARFGSRGHYFAYAATAMRHVLIDRARRQRASKRQGDANESAQAIDPPLDLIAIDQAVTRLAELAPRLARVVELRLFAGMSSGEIGALLNTTPRTIERDWVKARALLAQWLGGTS